MSGVEGFRRCFFAWRAGKTYQLSQPKSELAQAIKEVFYLHRRRYGARRISAELKADGLAVGRRLAGTLMKAQNLTAICPRAFKPRTTDSAHSFGFSANLLRDAGNEPTEKRQVIVGDITYLAALEWEVLLFGNFSGQVYTPHCRLGGVRADDGAARY